MNGSEPTAINLRVKSTVLLQRLLLLLTLSPYAEAEIRRIEHPDGRIEYTNVTAQDKHKALPGGRSETLYKYRNQQGTLSFTNQKPLHIEEYETLYFECYACQVRSTIDWYKTPLNTTLYKRPIHENAEAYQIDPALVRAIIHAESAFNPNAVSKAGASGLMQLMPATAESLGVTNIFDVEENIAGGVRYIAALLSRYQGDQTLATAAYNAGPGAVSKYKGIPPYPETQVYVERVEILRKRYKEAL